MKIGGAIIMLFMHIDMLVCIDRVMMPWTIVLDNGLTYTKEVYCDTVLEGATPMELGAVYGHALVGARQYEIRWAILHVATAC